MVDLLFKGLRTDGGGWVIGRSLIHFSDHGKDEVYISQPGELCDVTYDEVTGNLLSIKNTVLYKVYPESVCRYTGLTDKNDVKIFGRDVLSAYYDDKYPDNESRSVVVWKQSRWMMQDGEHADDLDSFALRYNEVIGNIYDNPGLVEDR